MTPASSRPAVPAARLRLHGAELQRRLRATPAATRRRMVDAAQLLLQDIADDAARGRSVLQSLIGRRDFVEWEHYPRHDAVDPDSGYRFYYHAHEASQRLAGEHGHIHLFAPHPTPRANGRPGYVHLAGISVDGRGFPLRVFTTNRWVTDEHWQNAAAVRSALRRLDLSAARPQRAARWVQAMTTLFAPQIDAVIERRDARIAARTRRAPLQRVLEDRRSHIVSQCRVDLAQQLSLLHTPA